MARRCASAWACTRGAPRDFFDGLVALGMLEREEDRYSNTPATELFLDRAKPSYVGGILEMANARLYPFWGSLTEGLRTGAPQNEAKGGGNFFEALYADPERLAQFAHAPPPAASSRPRPGTHARARHTRQARDDTDADPTARVSALKRKRRRG